MRRRRRRRRRREEGVRKEELESPCVDPGQLLPHVHLSVCLTHAAIIQLQVRPTNSEQVNTSLTKGLSLAARDTQVKGVGSTPTAVIVAAAPREPESLENQDPVPAAPASPVAARSHDLDPVNLRASDSSS
ncbi:unnamed protein product [Pleuronectes platessa]|uniref:Uncharacterized protein n=1 Tax=Pleuronectes platessa TaxID=8262 RepID=A0A9N7UD86_PLEPL|nr:unnamed protein product [Pleuronectes platessa]